MFPTQPQRNKLHSFFNSGSTGVWNTLALHICLQHPLLCKAYKSRPSHLRIQLHQSWVRSSKSPCCSSCENTYLEVLQQGVLPLSAQL